MIILILIDINSLSLIRFGVGEIMRSEIIQRERELR